MGSPRVGHDWVTFTCISLRNIALNLFIPSWGVCVRVCVWSSILWILTSKPNFRWYFILPPVVFLLQVVTATNLWFPSSPFSDFLRDFSCLCNPAFICFKWTLSFETCSRWLFVLYLSIYGFHPWFKLIVLLYIKFQVYSHFFSVC